MSRQGGEQVASVWFPGSSAAGYQGARTPGARPPGLAFFGCGSLGGSIIYRKPGRGGRGARKEEAACGSLNEFVNQTPTRSLNGPLKPRLTAD